MYLDSGIEWPGDPEIQIRGWLPSSNRKREARLRSRSFGFRKRSRNTGCFPLFVPPTASFGHVSEHRSDRSSNTLTTRTLVTRRIANSRLPAMSKTCLKSSLAVHSPTTQFVILPKLPALSARTWAPTWPNSCSSVCSVRRYFTRLGLPYRQCLVRCNVELPSDLQVASGYRTWPPPESYSGSATSPSRTTSIAVY